MKSFLISAAFTLLITFSTFGQTSAPQLTENEVREAKELAATFFNDYQKTSDIGPLIEKYFVPDFGRRLEFCRKTTECEGFARDFWKQDNELIVLNATRTDSIRQYAIFINLFYLYYGSIRYLELSSGKSSAENEEAFGNVVRAKLKIILKHEPQILALDPFENPDQPALKSKSVEEFRQHMANYEKFVGALRIVERELRKDLMMLRANTKLALSAKDFRAKPLVNDRRFFEFPVGRQMIEVWPEKHDIIFKMEMIKQNGKLTIVVLYPPID